MVNGNVVLMCVEEESENQKKMLERQVSTIKELFQKVQTDSFKMLAPLALNYTYNKAKYYAEHFYPVQHEIDEEKAMLHRYIYCHKGVSCSELDEQWEKIQQRQENLNSAMRKHAEHFSFLNKVHLFKQSQSFNIIEIHGLYPLSIIETLRNDEAFAGWKISYIPAYQDECIKQILFWHTTI